MVSDGSDEGPGAMLLDVEVKQPNPTTRIL